MHAEQDRVQYRHFVGYGAIFMQAEPRLENAITATQSVADGGARPDSSTENYIKGLVYGTVAQIGAAAGVTPGPSVQNVQFAMPASIGLLAIEAQCSSMWGFTFAAEADGEAKIDTYRGMIQLRAEGRRLCHALARMLGMKGVRADVFSPGTPIKDDDPFSYSDLEHWRRGP
jgi:hypothetical protein